MPVDKFAKEHPDLVTTIRNWDLAASVSVKNDVSSLSDQGLHIRDEGDDVRVLGYWRAKDRIVPLDVEIPAANVAVNIDRTFLAIFAQRRGLAMTKTRATSLQRTPGSVWLSLQAADISTSYGHSRYTEVWLMRETKS